MEKCNKQLSIFDSAVYSPDCDYGLLTPEHKSSFFSSSFFFFFFFVVGFFFFFFGGSFG